MVDVYTKNPIEKGKDPDEFGSSEDKTTEQKMFVLESIPL